MNVYEMTMARILWLKLTNCCEIHRNSIRLNIHSMDKAKPEYKQQLILWKRQHPKADPSACYSVKAFGTEMKINKQTTEYTNLNFALRFCCFIYFCFIASRMAWLWCTFPNKYWMCTNRLRSNCSFPHFRQTISALNCMNSKLMRFLIPPP